MKKQTTRIPQRVRILSLFLAVSMFFGLQGFEVLAETVSENAVKDQESLILSGNEEENGEKETKDNSNSVSSAEVPEIRIEDEEGEQEDAATLTNPEHHCTKKNDGTDYTDWSYVWFGSYPQSEVTDKSVIASIDSAIAEGNVSGDTGKDVWVNGTKYRRISKEDTNYNGYFDNVENNGYRYFKWERIKWRVLQKNEDTLFVIADNALDCEKYNNEYTSVTWETSTIRNWLNSSFYDTAFNNDEQSAIAMQNVVNEDNPEYGTKGGNDTSDKIYLLSDSEVTNETYGFCSDSSAYSMSRRMKTSDYANARGTYRSNSDDYKGNCRWWLRSPGGDSSDAAYVNYSGYVSRFGSNVYFDNDGVCPALHINLASDIYLTDDDGTSGSGGEESEPPEEVDPSDPSEPSEGGINNPVYDEASDTTKWSYVWFGSYPQSEVTDKSVIASIDSAIAEGNVSGDTGKDVWVNGTKYRRISKEDTNYDGYFDDVPASSGYRYFKWERIKWRVLQKNEDTLFVVADKAIDCQKYNDESKEVTWETSTLRDWLNNGFYQTAFSSEEQGAIEVQNIVNEDNPEYGTEGGEATSDKVYLLSISETTDKTYGFCDDFSVSSMSRRMEASDYANARGTGRSSSDDYKGNCWWWLRSPGGNSYSAAGVYYGGYVGRGGSHVIGNSDGACPALHINLASDIYLTDDDGTSGSGGEESEPPEEVDPSEPSEPSEGGINNPVYDEASDTTKWSYVWFGSYPQSEVTDSSVIAAIDSAIAKGNVSGDTGKDVWVNGTKYRRISKEDTNYNGYFDNVENNGYRYFKWERIKWRVLQKNEDTLFVIADNALDCEDYNNEYTSVTWETSTIRNWLNSSFYNTAFNNDEQSAIEVQNIVNEDNPEYGTEGGEATSDKVYLLSISETTDKTYGFCDDSSVYSMSRRMEASDYANARGTYRSNSDDYKGNCRWWLRSPGFGSSNAAYVDYSGWVYRNGFNVNYHLDGACPALHINLASDIYLTDDDGTSGSGGGESEPPEEVDPSEPSEGGINNPVYDEASDTTKWSYVWFGSYPQSEVTDRAVIASIDSAIAKGNVSGDTGKDVWVNGTKYRRISKEDTNHNGYFDNVENNGYRYFKWERIKWRVLQKNEDTLFVVADKAIDCQKYNDESKEVTWETSTLRDWLNNGFYQTAFSSEEQGAIEVQNIVNEDNPAYGTEGGKATSDKVYLLSISETTDKTYGFCDDFSVSSMSRRMEASDYANARGTSRSNSDDYKGNCWWWLRSPGVSSSNAACVLNYGWVSRSGLSVDDSSDGACPALHINLASDIYLTDDDGTSGSGGGEISQPIERADGDPLYNEGSDTTEWSYIYFGSYPQTEVTGTELTAAITGAAYDSNGDAWVNGIRYRRLAQKDVEHTENFGDGTYRYFKWERLKWRILKNEGSTLFVMAEQAIDGGTYHSSKVAVTWEKSQSRSWLNETFYKTAFTSGEQAAISQYTVKNESNPYSHISGGNDTKDRIYLLSLQEATNPEYGFCEEYDKQSQSRLLQVSDYAFVRGISRAGGYGNNCMWWLRTPGASQEEALMVVPHGGISLEDNNIRYYNIGYAPVMHIDTSALAYREEPEAPVHHCTKDSDNSGDTDGTDWSYVYFGSYPQSEITGSAITSAIRGAAYDSNGDAWVNGTKYRRISKADTNYSGYFGNNTYRYFKWERIKWRVLENDGNTLFLMADNGLDCKSYHQQNVSVTWKDSTLRSWLNQTFYQTAFSQEERMAVTEQTVSNENNPYYGTAGGAATKDKVYLLSYGEAVNSSYGFCTDEDTCSVGRRVSVSDYAHTMGASVAEDLSGGDETTYKGKCLWWLRTPGGAGENGDVQNTIVYCSGEAGLTGSKVTYINLACVPVLHIKTDSAVWMTKDDGTSGSGGGKVETPPVVDPPTPNPPTPNPPSGGGTKPVTLPKPVLKVKINTYNSVKLSWNQVSGAAGYHVYRATKKNGSYKKIKTLSSTSLTDKKLKKGKTYYYKVVAYRSGAVSSTSNIVSKKMRGRPKTPKIKITRDLKKKTYTVWWGNLKNVKKVEVWRATKKKGKYKKVNTISAVKYSGVLYSYAKEKGKFQYYYKVRSYYVEDGKKIYSKYSNIKGFGFK